MTDVHRLPEERVVMRQASEWLARLNADDVTTEDRARFEQWRSAHPAHARAYDDLSGTWARFDAAGPLVRAVKFAQSMNEAAEARPLRRRMAGWAAAAAVVTVIVAIGWLSHLRSSGGSTYVTDIGEHATVSLPDGSTVELDSDTRARVAFSKANRRVYLQRGEAFFKVSHDARRPFWVIGGGSWVRAVGTAFNVDIRSSGIRVTVSEGVVRVGTAGPLLEQIPVDESLASAGAISTLAAGSQADVRKSATEIRKLDPAQLARSVAWREGMLYFEDQPLGEVVDELHRYSPLEITIPEQTLRQLPIGGAFQAGPQGMESLLSMLEKGLGLTLQRESDRVIIEDHRVPHRS